MASLAGRLHVGTGPRPARLLSGIVQSLLLIPVVRWFCRPLLVRGPVPDGPALFVANHASHADTAAIIAALPWRMRRTLAPAAAEDYFFSSRLKGWAVRVLTGAYPFPRHGDEGLNRARRLLASGRSVLLFPEGTRSRTGEIAPFKCGVAKLAVLGYPVVPVGVAGTRDVLPAKSSVPRRESVSIAFGEPRYFDGHVAGGAVAAEIEAHVRRMAAQAELVRKPVIPTWHARVARLARSRAGLILAFGWGVAEAVFFPIVPDFAVVLMAMAAPRRAPLLALAAIAGSVSGGAATFLLGALLGSGFLEHAPLVTGRMTDAAAGWLANEGAGALAHQPWSGVPFKVFAWQAAGHDVGMMQFLAHTLVARAPRIALFAGAFAGLGFVLRRYADRFYGALALTFIVVFSIGLARVAARWA